MSLLVPILFALLVLVCPWPIGGNWAFARTCFIGVSGLALLLASWEQIFARQSLADGEPPTRSKFLRWLPVLVCLPLILGMIYSLLQSKGLLAGSVYPIGTQEKMVDLVMGIGLFIASMILLRDKKRITWVLAATAIVGVAVSFFGIAQNLSWNGKLFWQYELLSGGWPFASFVNKNNGAGFLLLTYSAATFFIAQQFLFSTRGAGQGGLILSAEDWENENGSGKPSLIGSFLAFVAGLQPKHLYFAAGVLVIFAGILISLSRGGMVALAVVSLITFFLIARANRWLLVILTIAMIGCGVGLIMYTDQANAITAQLESFSNLENAAAPRIIHWNDAFEFAQQNPIWGTGNGTYRYVSPTFETDAFQRTYAHAENIYLETFVEMGVVGCLCLLAAIGICFAASIKLYNSTDSFDRALGLTGFTCLIGQVIASFFDFGLYQPANTVVMAVLMGLMVGRVHWPVSSRSRISTAKPSNPLQGIGWLKLVIILVAIGGTCWAGYQSFGIESRKSASRALALLKLQHGETKKLTSVLEKAKTDLETAIKIRPQDSEAHYQMGEYWLAKYRIDSVDEIKVMIESELAQSKQEDPAVELDVPSDEMIWNSTSISILHREFRMAQRGNAAYAEELRGSEKATQYLAPAFEQFKKAEEMCPRLAKTQLRLAQLSAMFGRDEESEQLKTALARAPNNTQTLYDCGLLALNSGNQELAIELWSRVLTNPYSHTYERPIVELSQMELPMKALFERVLPQNPEQLLKIARKYFHEPRLKLPNRFLLVHTKKVIEKTDLSETERQYFLAEANRLSEEFQTAADHYRKALELDADQVVWRFDYASCLHRIGEYDEAIRQLKICELESSKIHSNIKPLLNRIRRDRVAKRD